MGLGGDADLDVDSVDLDHGDLHGADAADIAFKVLSLKTLIAFLAFFGLAGLAGQQAEMPPTSTLLLALGAGAVAVFVVAYIMAGLAKLQSKGNVDLNNAVGAEGRGLPTRARGELWAGQGHGSGPGAQGRVQGIHGRPQSCRRVRR